MTAWVSLSEAKAALNVTSSDVDAELALFIDAACEAIDRQFGPIGPATFTDYLPGGFSRVVLRRAPIVSITSVVEYVGTSPATLSEESLGGTYTDDGYRVDLDTGVITRTTSGYATAFSGEVAVEYVAGYDPIPADAKRGALELIRHLWETQRGRSTGRPIAGFDDSGTPGTAFSFPNRVVELLAPFRMPRVS